MFQSLNSKSWSSVLALVVAVVSSGCSSVVEWEKEPGKVELFATPLPPVPGESLVLGLRASNVGPIEVYQGDTPIATFFNIDLKELKAYEVTAVSTKTPRVEAVAFDYTRIEVNAKPFEGAPPAVEPDLKPTEVDAGSTDNPSQ